MTRLSSSLFLFFYILSRGEKKVLMKRNHVLIAFMLFFVLIPNSVISDALVFVNGILENKTDVFNLNWIVYNADLVLAPIAVWFGAIYPDFDLRYLHRKLLHNIFAMILPAIGILLLFITTGRFNHGLIVTGAFCLGCSSHILADCITPYGTWVFWPVSKKFKIRGPVKVGSLYEGIIMMLIIIVFAIYMAYRYTSMAL